MADRPIQMQFDLALGDFSLAIDLAIPSSGFTVLFGRSGCGKTTLLRCIAGLQRAKGKLMWGNRCWQDNKRFVPPHQRPLAYVFQEPRLFPHLDVRQNLEFGFRRIPMEQRRIQLDEAVQWLGLEPLLTKRPTELSGGQRQRVAIARALLTSPQILLMDEPLANLDLDSKAEILPYLEQLRSRLQIPVIYVTHSPDEMARLGEHLLLMENGHIRAQGKLNDLLTQLDLPLAHQLDASSVINVTVALHDDDYHLSYVTVPGGKLTVARTALTVGSLSRVRILARDVSIALEPAHRSSISNCLACRIMDISEDRDPAQMLVRLDCGGEVILSRITRRSRDLLQLQPDQLVYAQIKAVALMH